MSAEEAPTATEVGGTDPVVACQAVFNYPRRGADGETPKTNKTGDEDPTKETMVTEEVIVPVHDARCMPTPAVLNQHGFTLVNHETTVNFNDDAEIRAKYYTEMEELVKEQMGAERCVLFDHTVRNVAKANTAKGFGTAALGSAVSMAVNKVHGDYTATGAPRRIVGLSQPSESGSFFDKPPLTKDEADKIVAGNRRFAIVNVWRNISRDAPVKRMPLAVMDCTSVVEKEDLFTVELIFKDRVGENLALDEKPYHRWFFYPEMKFEEAILFKTFDSSDSPEHSGRFTIHSAFDDPRTKAEDPTRESIEVRVVAIFPLEEEAAPKRACALSDNCIEIGEHHS
eukprot:TRINITY_DN6423_c0_g2_i2.p1 TRINITY_DN6423_c0_g2~~TRINITY_DN6423_c0_g2_i2.p1  ORF type:complete len:341 (-),score=72.42 TRINITY_DN6423_c0_g2_i2:353-1375(-)